MYVQMVWGRTRPGAWDGLRKLYVDKVLPLTMAMPGVRERQLWRGASDPDEMVFWSVWDSLGELRNYEVSDARRDLAQETDQYFYPLAYPKGETWIKHFEVLSDHGASANGGTEDPGLVMMAWGKLRLGTWDQYECFYRERVEPTSAETKGLLGRRLLRSTEDPDEGVSVSLWNSEQDLMDYERSDLRRDLARDVADLYRGEFWVKHFEVADSTSN